jgi:secretory phospholipase A2
VPRGCRSFIESLTCSVSCSFRACLKMVDTSDANLVGKLFFNVVQTKCFVIKPKKVCVRSSWWGQCQKYKHVKQAILRDNLPY